MVRPAGAAEDTAPQAAQHFLVDGETGGFQTDAPWRGQAKAGAFGLSESPGWRGPWHTGLMIL